MDTETASAQIPFTQGAKQALELSLRETTALGHSDIGTEHILLALLRDAEGIAARVLQRGGIDLPTLRTRIRDMSSEASPNPAPPARPGSSESGRTLIRSLQEENAALRREVDRLRQFITGRLGAEPPAAAE